MYYYLETKEKEKKGGRTIDSFTIPRHAKKHIKKLMGSLALETVNYYSEHHFEIKSRHNEMKDQYKVFLPT